jgi:hypothetical protein
MEHMSAFDKNSASPAATVSSSWDPRAPAYASKNGRAAPLSGHECVFLAKDDDTPHVMTLQVLQALDQCREFRTLDDHVARIEANLAGMAGKREAIRRVLDGLVDRGLLLRDEDFLTRLRSTPRRDPPPLRAVYIRACDRPDRLESLLSSLAGYEQRHRAKRRYVLIDDSVLPASGDAQRDLLRGFARTTGCEVAYVGRTESAKLADSLAKVCPDARDAVRTLLLREAHPQARRFGGGRSRNLALLLSAGARLVLLDDDLRLPLRRPDFARNGLDPNPDAAACARFYEGTQQALAGGDEIDEDPFELHLDVCGQPLGACANGRYDLKRDALRGLNLGRLELLEADARIVTSHHGSCGSSRSESTLWLYHAIDRIGREELWQDRGSYQRNRDAHYVFYAVSKARVLDVPGFTPFALDNSALLPCTNPVGRAEDSLGAVLTRFCRPNAVGLELPVAIGHVQESLRARFPITREANPPRVNDFLREFVRRQFGISAAQEPAQRLALLAGVMRDLARASVRDRIEHLREYLNFVHADTIGRLQHQLEAATDAPAYWQADVRAIVQANANRLLATTRAAPSLAEWPQDIDADGCASALSAELDSMADACEHWPALWRYAAEQGEKLLAVSN